VADDVMRFDLPWLTERAQRWAAQRTFGANDLPDARDVAARKRSSGDRVSVVLPALDEEATVGDICGSIVTELIDGVGLVDELLVIDGGSSDRTATVARAAGAKVVPISDVMSEVPPVRGKGESLWRSLSIATGDIICWIDADIRNFRPHFVTRLITPLLLDTDVSFSKAFYRRPIATGDRLEPQGGGRVTELLARPLLNALFPELSGMLQPLSGEYAGRREILESVPFFTGYSVEVGLLIDLVARTGLDAMVQVDLDERVHRNRPLSELTPMAYAIARTIMQRAEEHGRLRSVLDHASLPLLLPTEAGDAVQSRDVVEFERPPLAMIRESVRILRSGDDAVAAL